MWVELVTTSKLMNPIPISYSVEGLLIVCRGRTLGWVVFNVCACMRIWCSVYRNRDNLGGVFGIHS